MIYCNECGSELKDDAKFCPKCGASVGNESNIVENSDDKMEYYSNLIFKIYDESLGRYRYSKAKMIGVIGFLFYFIPALFLGNLWNIVLNLIIGIVVYGICVLIGRFVRKFL